MTNKERGESMSSSHDVPTTTLCGGQGHGPLISTRSCFICNEDIPQKRLEAVPDAKTCVKCLAGMGDVEKVKRFDEFVGEEQVSTYFTTRSTVEFNGRTIKASKDVQDAMLRLNNVPASKRDYARAVGDDSFLVRPKSSIIAGFGLQYAFDEGADDLVCR
jgi:hypothetical protein